MRYKVILCDAPWKYNDTGGASLSTKRGDAEASYPTMENEELEALPVRSLADDDCMLCMWLTMPKLPIALSVIKAWGFRYLTCGFVWIKLNPKVDGDEDIPTTFTRNDIYSGLGRWVNGNVEMVAFASVGHPERCAMDIKQIVLAPRGAHSKKPAIVHSRIERLFGDVSRLELFAREPREGWTTLGNGIEIGRAHV